MRNVDVAPISPTLVEGSTHAASVKVALAEGLNTFDLTAPEVIGHAETEESDDIHARARRRLC